jgi:endo-alpha-1,4-polygalactosaminidase (GH114 family)
VGVGSAAHIFNLERCATDSLGEWVDPIKHHAGLLSYVGALRRSSQEVLHVIVANASSLLRHQTREKIDRQGTASRMDDPFVHNEILHFESPQRTIKNH